MSTVMAEPDTAAADSLAAQNARLESAHEGGRAAAARARIAWAVDTYGEHAVVSTSFGIQSAVMLHLATQVKADIAVVFVDTGYLFPETYQFAHRLEKRLGLNLKKYHGQISPAEQEALHGKLWEQGVEGLQQYNFVRKVEPMNRAIAELGARAWLSGLRRSQASTREDLPVLKQQNRIVKVHPIVDWSDKDIYEYLTAHDLPYHPLWEKGYISVGDVHSTTRFADGMRPEDTRFGGLKRECGLHELSGRVDFQI